MKKKAIASLEKIVKEGPDGPRLLIDHLEVYPGDILGLLGPNGAGKSTLTRIMGLLEEPTRGKVRLFGEEACGNNALSLRRRMACVFQTPLLFTTTVEANVAAGLHFRGLGREEIEHRTAHWLKRLGIHDLAKRPGREISGGEAQRVSLARAMILEPEIFLMDEPFANLDAPTRSALIEDMAALFEETGVTVVFVSHDRDEVLRLATRAAVLIDGCLVQEGSLDEVFNRPATPQIAEFVGVETIVAGEVVERMKGMSRIEAKGCTLYALGELPDGPVLACIRPEHVVLAKAGTDFGEQTSIRNRIEGRVALISHGGFAMRIEVDCGFRLAALITRRAAEVLALDTGSTVVAMVKASAIHCIQRERKKTP